jgi:hypothetical protein
MSAELTDYIHSPSDDFDFERQIVAQFLRYCHVRNSHVRQGDKSLNPVELQEIIDDFINQCVKR